MDQKTQKGGPAGTNSSDISSSPPHPPLPQRESHGVTVGKCCHSGEGVTKSGTDESGRKVMEKVVCVLEALQKILEGFQTGLDKESGSVETADTEVTYLAFPDDRSNHHVASATSAAASAGRLSK